MTAPDWRSVVDRHYPPGEARTIMLTHSRMVAELANILNHRCNLGLDSEAVETAAMLHDIGIIMTDARGIGCYGSEPYIRHGILGADMIRRNGLPEWAARVAERHTGAGLTADDIISQELPLPLDRVLVPETVLERLICYADKFYSKNPGSLTVRKPGDRVRISMARHGDSTLARFEALEAEFGPVE
ncbi:MAG: HDIG domain-containing protein [Muribaculaceae bacterium]|nr:HDIG domain-containing protein [Muribaculaceae bacterium]